MQKLLLISGIAFSGFAFSQVGINTSIPTAALDIVSKDNTASTKGLKITNSSGNEIITVLNNGNLGVGVTNPGAKVDINASTVGTGLRLADGSQGNGKVMVSDAFGNARWDNVSAQYLLQQASNTTDIIISKTAGVYTTVPGLNGFTAQSTGKYLIQFHCFLKGDVAASDKAFYFIIFKNGTQILGPETYLYVGPNSYLAQAVPVIVDIVAGDIITYQFADGTLLPTSLTFRASDTNRNFVETMYLGK